MPKMAEDSLRSAIDAIRNRLHEELETQLAQLTARHGEEVESARRAAEAEAEQLWSARVDQVRNEWTSRLESEVGAVRAEAERRMVAESTRLRVEAEQAAAESAAAVRDELERALAEERARGESELRSRAEEHAAELTRIREEAAAERSRLEEHAAAEKARLEGEAAAERSRLEEQLVAERSRLEESLSAERARFEEERARLEQEANAQRAQFEDAAAQRARAEEQLAAERSRAEEQLTLAAARAEELDVERRRALDLEGHKTRVEEASAEERGRLSQERDDLQRTLDAAHRDLQGLQSELGRVQQAIEGVTRERDGAFRAHQEISDREQQLASELARERQVREDETRQQEERARQREEQEASLAEARLAERQSQLAVVERVLTAVRSMDTSRSLSDVLSSVTASAASEAPRVALFVVNGAELRGWKSVGFNGEASAMHVSVKEPGVLGEALRRREPVVTSDSDGPPAPAFAELPGGRAAMAVPLLVGNQPVAVLYADDAADGTPAAPASWPEAIQILGRHASVTLAHLTAARAAEAMRRSAAAAGGRTKVPNGAEDGNSARRYARLLVSEIKLYNEAAVQVGRQKRDLLARLKPEIERARKLYSQRISTAVDSRGALFQQELVQTLADGDPSLLGNPA